jgi:HSP20 family molecular chaperone IbpA
MKKAMKPTLKIPREILATVDFWNTLQGGRSESSVVVNRNPEGYEAIVRVPGVDADDLQVEVIKDRVWLYHLVPLFQTQADEQFFSPNTISNLVLPRDVDAEAISARYEGDQWRVLMPFNKELRNFRKHVDIET